MDTKTKKTESFRAHLARVVEIGASDDWVSRGYDFLITGIILINLTVSVLCTFDELDAVYGRLFDAVEAVTVACFAVDYVLIAGRRLAADSYGRPGVKEYYHEGVFREDVKGRGQPV